MAWDSQRPVPWQRLIRDWLLYAAIMVVVLLLLRGGKVNVGTFLGLVASAPIFLVIGAVLAKFGYQRKTMKDLRSENEARQSAAKANGTAAGSGSSSANRAAPAPTRRTASGPNRPSNKQRRR